MAVQGVPKCRDEQTFVVTLRDGEIDLTLLTIHLLTPADHALLEVLLHDAYAPVLARLPAEDANAWSRGFGDAIQKYAEKGHWYVARDGSDLLGGVAFFEPGSTLHPLFQGPVAHVQLLGVATGQTRRGVGRALMTHCLALATASGAQKMLLQTSNYMTEARHLYESLGFAVERVLPEVWGAPTYLYAKALA
jgi:ribosomal protein S18 acetylase RimI-like enzyme